jgi:hypothetical protein
MTSFHFTELFQYVKTCYKVIKGTRVILLFIIFSNLGLII